MKTKAANIIIAIIVLLSIGLGIWAFPQLPESVASHWNAQGEVDGHMSRFWGIALMPLILIGISLMFQIIPNIDPLKKNINEFRNEYNGMIVFISAFMFYVHILTLLWNIGIQFNLGNLILPGISILFIYIGIMMRKFKRNFFIGIRTPWTLSSDVVWKKTHQVGGWCFIVAGLLSIPSAFFGEIGIYIFLACVFGAVIVTTIYSFLIYRSEENSKPEIE
ncbi:MAG: SdpI family protein [Anaerolineaceae bacterium]|nr:SdpI family protein [Anaerolineaceae bacterium]